VHPLVREAALPALRSLAEDNGATAHLTLVDGAEALAVAVVEPSWTDFHVSYRVGSRHPLGVGAAGRAILLGREPGSPSAPAWVVTVGELQPGARGLAVPVREVEGLEASVGVVTMAELDEQELGARVAEAAGRVAAALNG
jgi:DNA-binding IclR family transcriptional regulator